jgi:hypothetical protein
LCRSHIIPAWAYRPLYEDDSCALDVDSETLRPRKVQGGEWEYLFCEDCEAFFNKRFDQPFHRFWGAPDRFPEILSQPEITLYGIDYEVTVKFLLSVL